METTASLIDTSKCMGCRGCQVACKQWNDRQGLKTENAGGYENPPDLSPQTWTRIKFTEREAEGKVRWLFLQQRCLACGEASCINVCPTNAIKRYGVAVVVDQTWCIGCGYCRAACPFDIPRLGEGAEKSTMHKCSYCTDRISNGLPPACTKTCPAGALAYGERKDIIASGRKRVEELKVQGFREANLYGDNLPGVKGLGVMYVLTEPPSVYGLPENPQLANKVVGVQWLSGLVTAGVVAALPFWLLLQRRNSIQRGEAK